MLGFIFGLVFAAVPSALSQFSNPKSGEIFTVGGQISVTYNTSLEAYNIALWQKVPDGGAAILGPVISNVTDGPASIFAWTIDVGTLDLTYSKRFFLWLFPNAYAQGNQSAPDKISSGYFTIIDKTPGPTRTSSSSTTSSTTTTSSSSSTGSTTGTTTSSPDSQQPKTSDEGLSTGAKAGIGIGVGVGALVMIALGAMFLRYRSKKDAEIRELRHEMQNKSILRAISRISACGTHASISSC
ncbi:hypothetical protein MAC_07706 [Metarhizium acridum CQMa 102]|uniref:Uncharacterized protein n=1 Tax=Metarhizium acridum (strain CQMa 102) TaxID=655827 RepID=E9ECV8_METAQ|nr:uncharacterized protein MAC_07706 [Metarhizium acridum CQMa 102]EFY86252.1 hypothetical protein MAC_07706 [Metarhizium acridum CQMa 102]